MLSLMPSAAVVPNGFRPLVITRDAKGLEQRYLHSERFTEKRRAYRCALAIAKRISRKHANAVLVVS
jgi:hypothetical protein